MNAEPAALTRSRHDLLAVDRRFDGLLTIHVHKARVYVTRRLVRPLLDGLKSLDVIPLPAQGQEFNLRVNDLITLSLQDDASVVVAIGPDDRPCDAIEVPATRVHDLTVTLANIVASQATETMISPARLITRATTIIQACGGCVDPRDHSPHGRAAMAAYECQNSLMFARIALGFLHLTRGKPVRTLAWHYRAYGKKRALARTCIDAAAEKLAEAERLFAAIREAA